MTESLRAMIFRLCDEASDKGNIDCRKLNDEVNRLANKMIGLSTVQSYVSNWRRGKATPENSVRRPVKKVEFKLPTATTYSSKTSTITKAFVDAIAPVRKPNEKELEEYHEIFPRVDGRRSCAYCGDGFRYYEHFRPLVQNKMPSGYGSDIYNLVPSCSSCNEQKHGQSWREYMDKRRIVEESVELHQLRWDRLEKFERWGAEKVLKVDFRTIAGNEDWQRYVSDLDRIHQLLLECYTLQKSIKDKVKKHVSLLNY